jgi:hypothetical protein
VPERRIVYEAIMKDGNSFRHTFDRMPSGEGTHLSKRFEATKLSLSNKLMAPFAAAFIVPGAVAGDLERIKACVEGNNRSGV